jgi:hypothetical protein
MGSYTKLEHKQNIYLNLLFGKDKVPSSMAVSYTC